MVGDKINDMVAAKNAYKRFLLKEDLELIIQNLVKKISKVY